MISQVTATNFQTPNLNQKPAIKQLLHFTSTKKPLSQPVTDQVSFTGAVLKMKTLQKVVKKLGYEIVKNKGNHSMKIVGKGLSRPIPLPVHGHGKDIATGTANSIAKELGFKNMYKLNQYV